ncbi:MAG: 16S rRNA (uracil(1498)-N(3))-methyltransferase [Clostridiales bacterium]|nr:16S rRNA (uracil(1498)-N(3))-methyltransferase [Clostridiales bacterium]
MYHFFVPEADGASGRITIVGSDVNHIKNVLRMKPGEKIVVSNGEDCDFYCVIAEILPDRVEADVLPEEVEESELSAKLILFQGLPKNDKMEWIIQKAVELGAYEIVPVAMKRSVVRLDEKKQKTKIPRWNSISESAAKQSGRRVIPEVTGVMSWKEAMTMAKQMDRILVPYENARGMEATKEALEQLKPGMKVGIFIGPEGGFESSEIEEAREAGALVISLGHRILRTETAGMAALTMCMMQLELS